MICVLQILHRKCEYVILKHRLRRRGMLIVSGRDPVYIESQKSEGNEFRFIGDDNVGIDGHS